MEKNQRCQNKSTNPRTLFLRKKKKKAKTIQQEKKEASSRNDAGPTGCLYVKEYKQILSVNLHKTQVQVDQIPHIKLDTLNLMEEKVGNTLEHNGSVDNFVN